MATTPLKKTPNEWLQILAAAGKGIPDEIPPGFKSVPAISSETGMSETQTRRYLREAVKLGLVEERKLKVVAGNKLYPSAHFKICSSQKRSASPKGS